MTGTVALSIRCPVQLRERIAALALRPYGKPATAAVTIAALERGLAAIEADAAAAKAAAIAAADKLAAKVAKADKRKAGPRKGGRRG